MGRAARLLSSFKTYSLWKALCLVFDSKMTSLQTDRGIRDCKTKAYFLNTAPEISSMKRVTDAWSSLKKCCYTLCLGCRQILAKPDTLWTYNSCVQYVNSVPCFSTCWGPVVDLRLWKWERREKADRRGRPVWGWCCNWENNKAFWHTFPDIIPRYPALLP